MIRKNFGFSIDKYINSFLLIDFMIDEREIQEMKEKLEKVERQVQEVLKNAEANKDAIRDPVLTKLWDNEYDAHWDTL